MLSHRLPGVITRFGVPGYFPQENLAHILLDGELGVYRFGLFYPLRQYVGRRVTGSGYSKTLKDVTRPVVVMGGAYRRLFARSTHPSWNDRAVPGPPALIAPVKGNFDA